MTTSWSLRSTAAACARCWNAFFHQRCEPQIYAAIRIVFATLVLISFAILYPDLDLWFTDAGVLPTEASREATHPYSWSLLHLVPSTSRMVHFAFWLAVAHTIGLLIGFLPRLNAFFVFVWIVSFQTRNSVIQDGEDTLLRMLAFLMIWMPSGHAWSIQSWVRRAMGRSSDSSDMLVPVWPLRLLQFQMAIMFLSSGLVKLGGDPWLNGTALYYVSRLDDHFGRFWVPAWLFDTPAVVALITWSVVLAEVAIPFLIWFRETRLPCLIVLVLFHLANEWTMNLFLFHWLMLCGWLSFVTPADLSFLRARRQERPLMA